MPINPKYAALSGRLAAVHALPGGAYKSRFCPEFLSSAPHPNILILQYIPSS